MKPRIIVLSKIEARNIEILLSRILTPGYDAPPKDDLESLLLAVLQSQHHAWQFLHLVGQKINGSSSWAVVMKGLLAIHLYFQKLDEQSEREVSDMALNSSRENLELDLPKVARFFEEKPGPHQFHRTKIVQSYALFILERLKCSQAIHLSTSKRENPNCSVTEWKNLHSGEILMSMGKLQQLQALLVCCVPDKTLNPTSYFFLVEALETILRDSFVVYSKVNYGIMELVERFENLSRDEAFSSLDVYRKAAQQAEKLTKFYHLLGELGIGRGVKFPEIVIMGENYLQSLQSYLDVGSNISSGSSSLSKPELSLQLVPFNQPKKEAEERMKKAAEKQFDDTWRTLFGLDKYSAPVPSSHNPQPNLLLTSSSQSVQHFPTSPVLSPSIDEQLLRSLHETAEAQKRVFLHSNSVSVQDPFAASAKISPPPYVQMAIRAQQQMAMLIERQLTARHLYYSYAMRGLPVPFEVQRTFAGPYRNLANPDNIGVRYGNVLVPYS